MTLTPDAPLGMMPAGETGPVTIIVDGTVVAKGRPRATRQGIIYTPAATRRYESHARLCAQLSMDGRAPIAKPCRAVVLVELTPPISWSQRRKSAAITGTIRPTKKPDADNYLKSAMDCLNNIVVADDSLIVELEVSKRYGVAGKLVITVTPLQAEAAP